MADASSTPAAPDPAEAWADLIQSFAELADAADEETWQKARANLEKAKTAWAEGMTKGVAGLVAQRATPPESASPAPG
jgi:hypothetical protein